jgi:tetratricopeptide (TPR) repeat protein
MATPTCSYFKLASRGEVSAGHENLAWGLNLVKLWFKERSLTTVPFSLSLSLLAKWRIIFKFLRYRFFLFLLSQPIIMKVFPEFKGFSSFSTRRKRKKRSKKKGNHRHNSTEDKEALQRRQFMTFSKSSKSFLGKDLFPHIWHTQENNTDWYASNSHSRRKCVLKLFNQACQLWTDHEYHRALRDFEHCLLLLPDEQDSSELQIKTYYAIGVCHLSMENEYLATGKFLTAWRMASGSKCYELSQPAKYMMHKAMLKQVEIQRASNLIQYMENVIDLELEGDYCFGLRDYELALDDYGMALRELLEEETPSDSHWLSAQTRIRKKIASVLGQMGHSHDSFNEWETTLHLYRRVLGSDHFLTQETLQKIALNHDRVASQ